MIALFLKNLFIYVEWSKILSKKKMFNSWVIITQLRLLPYMGIALS